MAYPATVPEQFLVREVIHCCQGINGKYIKLQGTGDTSQFVCDTPSPIPIAQKQLIGKIAELGWLLQKVQQLAQQAGERSSVVHRALGASATKETHTVLRTLAVLDGKASEPSTDDQSPAMTLRRLVLWLSEPIMRLRIVAWCLSEALKLSGGQTISWLHAASKHGDPAYYRTIHPLLEACCVPFFHILARWITQGVLDVKGESHFMIEEDSSCVDPTTFWNRRYKLVTDAVPSILGLPLAEKALLAGKTVAFLRDVCKDSTCVLEGERAAPMTIETIEATISKQLAHAEPRALDVILGDTGALGHHLRALRGYFLLAYGDFFGVLIDIAGAELDRPAKEVSLFSIQAAVDTALRYCHVSDFDVGLHIVTSLESRALEGDRGWDILRLSYHVGDGPAAAVLHDDVLKQFYSTSRLFWMIQRAGAAMSAAWAELNAANRSLQTLVSLTPSKHASSQRTLIANAPGALRYLGVVRADMAAFLTSLRSYLAYGVVEPTWVELESAVKNARRIDDVFKAIKRAATLITQGAFLDMPSDSSDVISSLRGALTAILAAEGPASRVRRVVDGFLSQVKAHHAASAASEVQGRWTQHVEAEQEDVETVLDEIHRAAKRIHGAFDRSLMTFLSMVPLQSAVDIMALSGRDVETEF